MKVAEFNHFKSCVTSALMANDDNSPIWYGGYLWIDLTKKQAQEIVKVLLSGGCEKDDKYVYTPSGLGISLEQ